MFQKFLNSDIFYSRINHALLPLPINVIRVPLFCRKNSINKLSVTLSLFLLFEPFLAPRMVLPHSNTILTSLPPPLPFPRAVSVHLLPPSWFCFFLS